MLRPMNTGISKHVKEEVKKLLPGLREEVKKEFMRWHDYTPGDGFYSDENLFALLPGAAYEYILLCWGIEPHRVTMSSVLRSLNNKLFFDLRHIVAHALRRLALQQRMNEKK